MVGQCFIGRFDIFETYLAVGRYQEVIDLSTAILQATRGLEELYYYRGLAWKEYIETGKVRFVYKHFAILGPESNRAAEASECAAEQGQFWAYHDLLFADQAAHRSLLNDEKLISLANDLGLDANALGECLKSNRYTNQIRQESQVVQALGVRGTPGFVVNGIYVAGAQPYETFAQIFDEQLARLGVEIPTNQASTAADTEIEGVLTFPPQSRTHQEGDIDYEHNVPPGGVHNAAWQNCGIYNEPVRAENVMHSLEHGAVWLAYQPGLPDDQVELLRTLARQALAQRDEPMVILSPQPDLDAPIVATAWQVQLKADDASDERLVGFLVRYQEGWVGGRCAQRILDELYASLSQDSPVGYATTGRGGCQNVEPSGNH